MLKLSVLGQPFGSTLIYVINDPISASFAEIAAYFACRAVLRA